MRGGEVKRCDWLAAAGRQISENLYARPEWAANFLSPLILYAGVGANFYLLYIIF